MFTLLNLYILMYSITLFFFFFYIYTYNLMGYITQVSFHSLWSVVTYYFKPSWPLKFLFLQLSGLPPFFFFYIKTSFIVIVMGHLVNYLQILVFLNIIISSFFYLKLFTLKNRKPSTSDLLALGEYRKVTHTTHYTNFSKKYRFLIFFYHFLFYNLCSFFFFPDLYLYIYTLLG